MLYLIKSSDFIKIGYTEDLQKRLKSYKTHNPNFKLLGTKKGNKEDETHLHRLLHKYKIDKTEWFTYSTFIIKVSHEYSPNKLDQEYTKNIVTIKHINKLLKNNDTKKLNRLKYLIDTKKLKWKDDRSQYLVWT